MSIGDSPSSESMIPVQADQLRQAMRRFVSGVTVVTAQNEVELAGITVSAFSSISLDPPVIMVSINTASSVAPVILDAEAFAVHILSNDQEALSVRFAESLSWEEKIGDTEWGQGISGAPILTDSYTTLDCELIRSLVIGTHTIMLGRVLEIRLLEPTPKAPLLYYDQNYRTLDRIPEDPTERKHRSTQIENTDQHR
ncbi:MAG: flavin reductase [Chlorobi bacterium]|nr:flavin reductase [Chlorobiota bacterium]